MKKTLFLLAILTQCCVPSFAQEKNLIDQPYIEVTGSFDTLITPNQIYIGIVVSEKDTKDKISLEKSEIQMIATLKDLGINTDKNLTIHDMASNYKKYLLKQKDILKSKKYMLMVNEPSMATRVFIALEKIGISNTYIDRAEHSDAKNIKNLCSAKALLDARNKAKLLASTLQQSLGSATAISDNSELFSSNSSYRVEVKRFTQLLDEEDYAPENIPQIEFKQIEISSQIFARFILK